MTRTIVIDAMKMALEARNPPPGLIFHSDKGSQYASEDFKRILWAAGVQQSMSGVGAYWDNAVVDSFFRTLKTGYIYHETYATRQAAKLIVFAWIEAIYNRSRLHYTLVYKTPVDFEGVSMAQVASATLRNSGVTSLRGSMAQVASATPWNSAVTSIACSSQKVYFAS